MKEIIQKKNIIDDLLPREKIVFDVDSVKQYIQGKTVLITGGGGSIGSELCRQIVQYNPKSLIILDVYENGVYDIEQEIKFYYGNSVNLQIEIVSVTDQKGLENIFEKYKPNIIFHAAAHKHVPLMESCPREAVKNNIFGTYNTASLANKYKADKFVLISSDKAVNPTSVMGATKRCCEKIVQTMSRISESTKFCAVRFGNVLGSNGSVIPLFEKQILNGGPVTVTHKDVIRYFMTIPEAVGLVLQAGEYANSGEIFVLDMGEQVKILTLAEDLIKKMGFEPYKDIDIVFTGLRAGEKLFEEILLSEEGLKKTSNNKIYVGKQIDFDDKKFLDDLKQMQVVCEFCDKDEILKLLKKLVPTYIV